MTGEEADTETEEALGMGLFTLVFHGFGQVLCQIDVGTVHPVMKLVPNFP